MSGSIKINKGSSVVFLGGMNAMPMMYALELKARGQRVYYYVDAKRSDKLSRPENHFPDIEYPYPGWIFENILHTQLLLLVWPRFFAWLYGKRIRKDITGKVDCLVLNGFFTALAPYFEKKYQVVSLSHGADLDVWAFEGGVENLAKGMSSRSIFKYLPNSVSRYLLRKFIERQYKGYSASNVVIYFPRGLNSAGDKVIDRLLSDGVSYVSRYDISFEPLKNSKREFKGASGKLNIFSGVRFLFRSFPEGNEGYSKGSDVMLRGLALYYELNKNIEIHLVEKGEDFVAAKSLCHELGLSEVVVWHKEMTFKQLLSLYDKADICFDQVGAHWIGAIGGYALWLGKPLIANDEMLIAEGVWPSPNPVCSAKTPQEILDWLVVLESEQVRKDISNSSKLFVEQYMSPGATIDKVFDLLG
ncbi:glycosyltransferase family 1 protein [Pseudomonas monteilii]|uniref:Glycosyltransferase n=1 Tax=Pseudomonas monteilii TaxID=76759 RepID=A0A2N1IYT5_9PSED|nr:glycosyltransferase family 1 protein [Pseudomonas monteilii]PKI25876.1 hypothetical protein CXB65_00065 [Pseudomonas monteilii]